MTDRIVEIAETSAFLSLDNHRLKIRIPEAEDFFIPVFEMQCLILANPAVSVSGALLAALAEAGCMVLVSAPSRLPAAMQLPLSGNYLQTERFLAQINAPKPLMKRLWQIVVTAKIHRQMNAVRQLHGQDFGLENLSKKVLSGDSENLESRAAKIYWANFFRGKFTRDRNLNDNNLLLNYGYAVLRAMTARACCAAGLHPTIGIQHHNRYDAFCLADDLMEPFRPLIDLKVFQLNPDNLPVFMLDKSMRGELISALLEKVRTKKGNYSLPDLLRSSAAQVADSFMKGEVLLQYE